MEKKNKLSPTSFRIPEELRKRLRVTAAELDTDSSTVVISGIEAWLEKNEPLAARARESRELRARRLKMQDQNKLLRTS